MTGWIIFGIVLLVLIWIFTRSVTITGIYDKNPELRIRILCFTLVKVPPDPEKQRRKAEKKARKEAAKARKEAKKQYKEYQKTHNGANHRLLELAEEENKAADGNTDSGDTAKEPDKEKQEDTAPQKTKAAKASKEKPPKKKSKLPDISFDMIRDYINSASPPIKRLFKKIRITDLYIDWVIGSEDAAATALKYGGICAAIYSLLEFLKAFFSVKIREVNIEADFEAEKDDIFAYITLKLRISTAIGCVMWLAVRVLKTYLRYNGKQTKAAPRRRRARA